MPAVVIKKLSKTYENGFKALDSVDLQIEEGDFFSLLGANGAGKTTIIGIMTGLVNKNAGTVKIFGYDIDKDFINAKKQIGVVPQEFNFGMFEKVEDIILGQAGYYGLSRNSVQDWCDELLEKLDLTSKKNTVSRALSGGMKRRLMIARALIHKPRLLILDEPTAGVDVELRNGMWDYLLELNKNGTTIILTTHYLEEVEKMCKNAAIIKKGQIAQIDTVKNLLSQNDSETYIIETDQKPDLDKTKYEFIWNENLEIIVNKKNSLNEIINQINAQNILIKGIRPKGNRLEKLFVN